ncbi:MAG: protein kinase [Anaerolineae bacterium]|nr:protein kinase [Thermoflexales bacterium]MDW8054125.1 protein kinase [Anaerolineae bacterium]
MLLNNRYQLISPIAAGGMATVYAAHDVQLDRRVAVKILRSPYAKDTEFVQRFRREAQLAASLNHPNIVAIYDVGHELVGTAAYHYIVMELVEGDNLKRYLQRRGQPLPVDEVLRIGAQLCQAVGFAHARGLVHCDIKPQNVLLNASGQVKVTDFGIARAWRSDMQRGEQAGEVWGTPLYYAPEQAAGAPPTPASDVYSIGVVLYELLTARLPFESDDPLVLARLHQTQPPPPIHALNPAVPLQLERVVMRALDKDPRQRYSDANAFARALMAYAQQGDAQTLLHLPAVTLAPADSPLATQRVAPAPMPPSATPRLAEARFSNDEGPDVLSWVLGVVAFLCVLGLVPLYVAVYRAYTQPGSSVPMLAATPTSSLGSSNQLVSAPLLIGRPLTEAISQATALGLSLNIVETRVDAAALVTKVVEQRPAAGSVLAPGSVIDVVVQQPRSAQRVVVPATLIGLPFSALISQTLSDAGFTVVTKEAFDFAPSGTILSAEPPPGSVVEAGHSLTLTLSSGGRKPLGVNMGPIQLDAIVLQRERYRPGEVVQFSVQWRALATVGRDYAVGWYLLTPDARSVLAQGEDRAPTNNGVPAPTHLWVAGTQVNDTYALRIPTNLPPGTYPLFIALYAGNERLLVRDPGATTAKDNLVLLHTIIVQ